jgi:hypothetical protein
VPGGVVTPRRFAAMTVAVVLLGVVAWNLNGAWDARRAAIDARNRARSELADLREHLATQRNRRHEARLAPRPSGTARRCRCSSATSSSPS